MMRGVMCGGGRRFVFFCLVFGEFYVGLLDGKVETKDILIKKEENCET